MISVYSTISTLNNNGANIVSVGDEIKFISSINESIVGTLIDEIKAFFRKLKEFLLKIYHAIFGGGSSRSSFSSSRSSSSGSTSSGFRWTAQDSEAIRRKLYNDYFINNFKWNLHDWDNRYIDSMSDKIRKMDNIRFRTPDHRTINSSAFAISREIVRCIEDYRSSGRTPKVSDDMLISFKDEINNAVERIYEISDGVSYNELLPRKIRSETLFSHTLKYADVDRMLDIVEYEARTISEIERSYKSLMNEINAADREIQSLNVDNTPPELTKMINALTGALQYKISVITSLEHIHIKAVRDRSAEYCRELRRFNNM